MASGFSEDSLGLTLSLLGSMQRHFNYRSGGSSGIKPHSELAEDFPSSYKLASSTYESSVLSGGSPNGPTYTESASSEYLKPASPNAGGYSGSYSRQVYGYSPEGSVSSSRPSPLIPQKPRKNPQEPRNQTNPDTNGIFQTKTGTWDFISPQNGNRFESVIASSYRSRMHSDAELPRPSGRAAPPQPQHSMTQSKAGMWDLVLFQGGVTPRSCRPIPMASE